MFKYNEAIEKEINQWSDTLTEYIKNIRNLIRENSSLFYNYSRRNRREDLGFNIFSITSDTYYKENYHSYILKAFLDPKEKHREGNVFLELFIDMLNKRSKNIIDKFDYRDAIVEREMNSIDILITDNISQKAIIIENKINKALDRPRQLPRYYEQLKRDNKDIDAIVYLTLDSNKFPNQDDWTEEDKNNINPILIIIPAYSVFGEVNLYHNWIEKSILASENIRCSSLLSQYGELIRFLNTNNMDTTILSKFYNLLKEENNLETIQSIRNMLNDLPEYLAIRIEERYKNKCDPFKNIWRYKSRDTVFEGFEIANNYFKFDIWCGEDGYYFHFWNTKDENYDMKKQFGNIKILADFEYYNSTTYDIVKHYKLFDEKELYNDIDYLLRELRAIKRN